MNSYYLYKSIDLDSLNSINNIYIESDINDDSLINNNNLNNKEDDYLIFTGKTLNPFPEEKSTTLVSKNKSDYNFTHFTDLKYFFKENKKFSQIYEKLKENKKIDDIENKLLNKKKKKKDSDNGNSEPWINKEKDNESKEKVKRGRKITKNNPLRIEHDRFSEDNIIRKIKDKIFFYILIFINNILKSILKINNKKKYKLYKLNYKLIIQLNKEKDLNYLNMSLKDLYSFDISSKYKKIDKKQNKIIINEIIEKKILVEDYPTIKFVFDLSLKSWMELFTYKKSIYEIIKENEDNVDINLELIEKSLVGAEELLKQIFEKNGEDYFSIFTFLLYNYKKWFDIKSGRKINTIK